MRNWRHGNPCTERARGGGYAILRVLVYSLGAFTLSLLVLILSAFFLLVVLPVSLIGRTVVSWQIRRRLADREERRRSDSSGPVIDI